MADPKPNQNLDKKPFGAYHFTVQLDGTDVSYPFRSCSGLKIETSVVDLEEGGFNGTTRKLVGRTKFPNIVLKRGFCSGNSELYALKLQAMNDLPSSEAPKAGWRTPHRVSGVITQLGPRGSETKWSFSRGIVCKWEGPDLDATKNEVSIESIEIAHEGLMLMSSKEESK